MQQVSPHPPTAPPRIRALSVGGPGSGPARGPRASLCFASLCFAPLCFARLCFAPLGFAPLCFASLASLCFAPLCFASLCFAPLCFARPGRRSAAPRDPLSVGGCGGPGRPPVPGRDRGGRVRLRRFSAASGAVYLMTRIGNESDS